MNCLVEEKARVLEEAQAKKALEDNKDLSNATATDDNKDNNNDSDIDAGPPRNVLLVIRGDASRVTNDNPTVVLQQRLLEKTLEKSVMFTFPIKPSTQPYYSNGTEYTYQAHINSQVKYPFDFSTLIDVVQAERNCLWENCTTDGPKGASGGFANAPFVNRWKAQMLLNTVCGGGYPYRHPGNYTDDWTMEDFKEAAHIDFERTTTSPSVSDDATSVSLENDEEMLQGQSEQQSSSNIVTTNTTKTTMTTTDNNGGIIRFVPFPHRGIGIGSDAACSWQYRDITDPTDPVVATLLGNDVQNPDGLQKAAMADTICVPNSTEVLSRLHLFSTEQAKTCLQNTTLVIVGDSYTRNLFIEMASVLFGRLANVEIVGGALRTHVSQMVDLEFQDYRARIDPSFPRVRHICLSECFGRTAPFWKLCADCVNNFRKEHAKERMQQEERQAKERRKQRRGRWLRSLSKDHSHNDNAEGSNHDIVLFAGVGVHINKQYEGDLNKTVAEIERFWEAGGNMIAASPVNYQKSLVPEQYRSARDTPKVLLYKTELVDQAEFDSTRLFDYFELTKSCRMENCSTDGGHRAHFVNRWKAQLLLNTLCTYESENME